MNKKRLETAKMEESGKSRRKFDYAWVIFALCFLCVCTSLGLCSSGKTYYLTAITEALDIKRSLYSLTDTIRYGITTLLNLFLGFFIGKFGVKKLLCAGFVSLIGFAYISSIAESLWGFYLGAVLLGIGLSWTSTAMMSAVVGIWCKKNKGTMTGIILSANGLGGAIAVQIISPIIFKPSDHPLGYEPFGYRDSYRLVAIILAVVLLLVVLFFKERPKGVDKGNLAVGKNKKKARGTGWVGMDYDQAVKKPYFYLAMLCIFLTGMSLQGIGGIATPHMYDLGFDKQFVANIGTVTSLCLMGTKIFAGTMYDRTGIKITMNICFICAFFSIGGLVILDNTAIGRIIALIRGIMGTVALPLETVMLPLFASELFGDKSFVKIVGIFSAANTAGLALGAPFANMCFDIFNNYNLSFVVLALFMAFSITAMNFVVRAANRDKKIILAALRQNEDREAQEALSGK